MTTFPIHHVDRSRAEASEPRGSKPKFWFREGKRRLLFKADDRETGEDWAEVIGRGKGDILGFLKSRMPPFPFTTISKHGTTKSADFLDVDSNFGDYPNCQID
jgi:hypothetical protein